MSKKSQEHPYTPALNGDVLRTKHDKAPSAPQDALGIFINNAYAFYTITR